LQGYRSHSKVGVLCVNAVLYCEEGIPEY
jgi:hypothetical protein